jgi:hypothetical protein
MLDGLEISKSGQSRSSRSAKSRQKENPDLAKLEEESAPSKIALKPLGRKCAWCPRKDNDWDPIKLAQGEKVFMEWGKPSYDGKTQGPLVAVSVCNVLV